MATRRIDAEVAVKVTGQDKVDDLEKSLDKISSDKIEVPVEVDGDAAVRGIDDLLAKVDKLHTEPANILLASNAAQISDDIAGLLLDIDKLDSTDPTVEIKIDQVNQLTGDLEKIQNKAKEINDTPVVLDTRQAAGNFQDLDGRIESSGSVLANMVGNATQDLGDLGGIAGSTGVAIGQMGEYMADAALAGKGLGSILTSFGTVALPIAGISLATGLITHFVNKQKEAREEAERLAEAQRDINDALREGRVAEAAADIAENYGKAFDAAKELGLPIKQVTDYITGQTDEMPAFNQRWHENEAAISQTKAAQDEYYNSTGFLNDQLVTQQEELLGTRGRLQDNKDAIDGQRKAYEDANDTAGQAVTLERQIAKALKDDEGVRRKHTDTTKDNTKATDDNTSANAKNREERRKAREEARAQTEAEREQVHALQDLNAMLSSMDWGTADLHGAVTAMDAFNEKSFALANMNQDLQESYAALGESIDDNGERISLTADVTTEAGRKQQDAIEGVANAMEVHFAAAFDRADGSQGKFIRSATKLGDETLAKLQEQFGLTDDEVAILRDQLNLTAGDYEARFHMAGVEEAKLKLQLLADFINNPRVLPPRIARRIALLIEQGRFQKALEVANAALDQTANPGGKPRQAGFDAVGHGLTETDASLNLVAKPRGRNREAGFDALGHGLPEVSGDLDETANPGGRGRKAPVYADADAPARGKAGKDIDDTANPADPRVAPIYAQALDLQLAASGLDGVAKVRLAKFFADVDDGSAANADAVLDNLAADRIADIFPVVHSPTGAQLPGRGGASGSTSTPEGWMTVGEHGEELAYFPQGTRLLPEHETRRVLREGSGQTLILGAGGGSSAPAPINIGPVQIHLQAGVIGNRYDVARTVTRATKDAIRIAGSRLVNAGN